MKSVLLSELGDLEAAWADTGLREKLLGLSLPAMELLLSCDELKVACEDNVLYTANKYVNTFSCPAEQSAAKQRLAPLVRCQHLSHFWTTTSVVSKKADSMVLSSLRPQLSQLLILRSSKPGFQSLLGVTPEGPSEVTQLVPNAPASWALGRRAKKPVSSVSVTWDLSVSALREAARGTQRGEKKKVYLYAPHTAVTAPLGGLAFTAFVTCTAFDDGCKIGVFAKAKDAPADTYFAFNYEIEAAGVRSSDATPTLISTSGYGSSDHFSLGAMAAGWDEAAWAAKGLPASGELPITLTVARVGHSVLM